MPSLRCARGGDSNRMHFDRLQTRSLREFSVCAGRTICSPRTTIAQCLPFHYRWTFHLGLHHVLVTTGPDHRSHRVWGRVASSGGVLSMGKVLAVVVRQFDVFVM